MALREVDAAQVARHFALGEGARLTGPVARGQLGQVWRLEAASGTFAVKEWFADPDPEHLSVSTALHERLWVAGIPAPAVVRSPCGEITAVVCGTRLRVLGWVDLGERTRRLPPTQVGRLLAAMHRASPRTTEPVIRWHSEGIGEQTWRELHRRSAAEGAPFADRLGAQLEGVIAAESVIEPPGDLLQCHRDLWSDNVLPLLTGGICVIDFENAGPADPSYELAMVLFEFGLDEPGRVRRLHDAYVAAGGPGRVTRRADFSMLVATLSHLAQLACSRWLGSPDAVVRTQAATLMEELLADPVTLARIDRVLAALRD